MVEQFEALLTPVLTQAYATARHLTRGDGDAAENLVQEAALRAFRAFHTFQGGTNFRAWFLRIVTNLYLEQYRRAKRAPVTVSVDETSDLHLFRSAKGAGLFEDPQADPARQVIGRLSQEQVTRALESLADEFRSVCSLYFVQEMSYLEISEVVGVPVGTVRSRLHRGRKMLQRQLWDAALEAGLVDRRQPA